LHRSQSIVFFLSSNGTRLPLLLTEDQTIELLPEIEGTREETDRTSRLLRRQGFLLGVNGWRRGLVPLVVVVQRRNAEVGRRRCYPVAGPEESRPGWVINGLKMLWKWMEQRGGFGWRSDVPTAATELPPGRRTATRRCTAPELVERYGKVFPGR